MANITLSDYTGFIFGEIVKARMIADEQSKRIALLYSQDVIMKHFTVPRFKIPEMELTIPVLISGAKFSNTLEFVMEQEEFKNFITSKIKNVIQTIIINRSNIKNDVTVIKDNVFVKPVFNKDIVVEKRERPIFDNNIIRPTPFRPTPIRAVKKVSGRPLKADPEEQPIIDFYETLQNNKDKNNPENIIQIKWAEIFNQRLSNQNLLEEYKKQNPNNELFNKTFNEIAETVKGHTVISHTKIDNILVNPETQTVKDGSNENSVFILKAKIIEDGLMLKEIETKEENGKEVITNAIVEFE